MKEVDVTIRVLEDRKVVDKVVLGEDRLEDAFINLLELYYLKDFKYKKYLFPLLRTLLNFGVVRLSTAIIEFAKKHDLSDLED